ncbi:MAG: hypothetical protein WA581_15435 [Candidatus Acidiferrales bacterium]
MNRKDAAGLGVYLVGAVAALFFGFMSFVIDHKILSLLSCSVVAFVLTAGGLLLFVIQQRESAEELRVERQENRKRDKLLEEILRNQVKQTKERGGADEGQVRAAEAAADLYSVLASDSRAPGQILITTNFDHLLETAIKAAPIPATPSIIELKSFLNDKEWRPSEFRVVDEEPIRALADFLAKSTIIRVHGDIDGERDPDEGGIIRA